MGHGTGTTHSTLLACSVCMAAQLLLLIAGAMVDVSHKKVCDWQFVDALPSTERSDPTALPPRGHEGLNAPSAHGAQRACYGPTVSRSSLAEVAGAPPLTTGVVEPEGNDNLPVVVSLSNASTSGVHQQTLNDRPTPAVGVGDTCEPGCSEIYDPTTMASSSPSIILDVFALGPRPIESDEPTIVPSPNALMPTPTNVWDQTGLSQDASGGDRQQLSLASFGLGQYSRPMMDVYDEPELLETKHLRLRKVIPSIEHEDCCWPPIVHSFPSSPHFVVAGLCRRSV